MLSAGARYLGHVVQVVHDAGHVVQVHDQYELLELHDLYRAPALSILELDSAIPRRYGSQLPRTACVDLPRSTAVAADRLRRMMRAMVVGLMVLMSYGSAMRGQLRGSEARRSVPSTLFGPH